MYQSSDSPDCCEEDCRSSALLATTLCTRNLTSYLLAGYLTVLKYITRCRGFRAAATAESYGKVNAAGACLMRGPEDLDLRNRAGFIARIKDSARSRHALLLCNLTGEALHCALEKGTIVRRADAVQQETPGAVQ